MRVTSDLETEGFSGRGCPSARKLAILAYHKIGEPSPGGWGSRDYIPEENFAEHLSYLRVAGWQVIGLPAFLRGITRLISGQALADDSPLSSLNF